MSDVTLITAVHFEGGTSHEHISALRWRNPASGAQGTMTAAYAVEWLKIHGNRAYAADGATVAEVAVVDATTPHLRTFDSDGWTDRLLELPSF